MTIYKLGGKSSKSSSHVKNTSTSFSTNTQKRFNDFNNNNSCERNIEEETTLPFVDVKVELPNGTVCHHSIDSQKAIYDLLIELSANARLIPTNFILKLYSDDNSDCLIDYTPNQKIGQLNPVIIKLVPKTATLKHQQQQLFPTEPVKKPDFIPLASSNSKSIFSVNNKSSSSLKPTTQTPFELTICVQVNLPFNQKTVVRVKHEILLIDLFRHVCRESNLDQEKYDLYIPNENRQYSLEDSFANFNTKQVSLVLKKNAKDSKCQSQFLFTQNKVRTHSRHYSSNIKNSNEAFSRSKSEVDLSFSNKSSLSEEHNSYDPNNSFSEAKTMKKDQKGHKSNGSLNSSYFTELKLTKTDLNDSKASLGSSKSQENKIKKRLAPAPPPQQQQHDNIDKCMHHNIYSYAKKKGKAPAPPPPKPSQQIEQIEPVESQQQQELTNELTDKEFIDVNKCNVRAKGVTRIINNSLIIAATKPDIKLAEHCVQASSSPLPQRAISLEYANVIKIEREDDQISGILRRNDSVNSLVNSEIDISINQMETSIMSAGSYNKTDDFYKSNVNENNEHIETTTVNKSTSSCSSNHSLNCVKSCTGAAIGQKSYSEDDYSDIDSLQAINSPKMSKTVLASISDSITSSLTNGNNLYNYDPLAIAKTASISVETKCGPSKPHTLFSSTEHSQFNDLQTPSPNLTSIIHVNVPKQQQQQQQQKHQTDDFEIRQITNNQQKSSTNSSPLNLRSPTSPPPQFPAIAEDDLNEQHQNYTVVRSGDIREKNGTYYSTDGTVRGYSGTVKKIANSKTLSEIFEKHKELEQQHEREYELELKQKQQKQEQQQKLVKTQTTTTTSIYTKPTLRSSLGNIIANEKRASLPSGVGLSSNSNIFKIANKNLIKQEAKIDDELSKKLENRRQSILASQKKQEEKLQQKAIQKQIYFENLNKEQSINLKIDVKSNNSLHSDSTYNSMSSSSSASSSKHSSQISPVLQAITHSTSSSSLSTCSSENAATYHPTSQITSNRIKLKPTSIRSKSVNANSGNDLVSMLLNELKSVVPLVEANPSIQHETIQQKSMTERVKVAPSTAPKNFNTQTLRTISQKIQLVDNRDNLLDSIKTFSFNSLRRISAD